MSSANAKNKALHVATMSGWYRFEKNGREWNQVKRDLATGHSLAWPLIRKIQS
jgi:hypothetical protein